MPKLSDILQQPEGRRLEFKESLPANTELAKTIIAFANDAGGELYVGIKDNPREVIGLKENDLLSHEEKIASLIHDLCEPVILPKITFLQHEDKHIIRTLVYKGSAPPYHLKNKTVAEGTFIRVGSTNRLASTEMTAELERQKQNISFDSELVFAKTLEEVNLGPFREFFQEKTGEELTIQAIRKLELFRQEQGQNLPTNAMILLSDDELRKQYFPYAKIECARFKGTVPCNFIDQKTIDVNIAMQPEQAYQFLLRHISQGTTEYTGVYRNDRWEYPVIAIREVIRNAVIHRDYSLTGKDIKIAIFDDKVEITSPGKLMPTVDFSDMESGQSEIRNRLLAPVFKRLGIIEQWGNGLKLIAEELLKYPGIELSWKEPGVSFRVTFTNKSYIQQQKLQHELQQDIQHELQHELQHESELETLYSRVLRLITEKPLSTKELSLALGQKSISGQLKKVLSKLLQDGLVVWTEPDSAKSSKQKYRITAKGAAFLKLLKP